MSSFSRTSRASLFNICSSCGGLYLEVLLGRPTHNVYQMQSVAYSSDLNVLQIRASQKLQTISPCTVLITHVLLLFTSIPVFYLHLFSIFNFPLLFPCSSHSTNHFYLHIQTTHLLYLPIKIGYHYYSLPVPMSVRLQCFTCPNVSLIAVFICCCAPGSHHCITEKHCPLITCFQCIIVLPSLPCWGDVVCCHYNTDAE